MKSCLSITRACIQTDSLKVVFLKQQQQRLTGEGYEGKREVEEGRRIKGNKKRMGGRDEMRKERTHMKE